LGSSSAAGRRSRALSSGGSAVGKTPGGRSATETSSSSPDARAIRRRNAYSTWATIRPRRTTCAWKTADAVPDLLALARSASDATNKRLALRGYLSWAANADLPADQRLSMCREAARVIQTAEEKKRLLAALGGITAADSLALIEPYLDEADTRDEAAAAVVSVAGRLLKGGDAAQVAPRLVEPLKKVVQVAADAELARRVKAALEQAQRRARRK